jgi:hypothetical protein
LLLLTPLFILCICPPIADIGCCKQPPTTSTTATLIAHPPLLLHQKKYIKYYDWKKLKTYNTGDSLVVTDPTTNPALRGLTLGERTGPRILHELWSYVLNLEVQPQYER